MTRCVIALLIYVLVFVRSYGWDDAGSVFYIAYWPLDFLGVNRLFVSYTALILSQLPLFILWGDYYYENLYRNASVIFTRTSGTMRLMVRYSVKLCIRVIGATLIMAACMVVVPTIKGGMGSEDMADIGVYSIYVCLLLLVANSFSLVGKPVIGMSAVMLLEAVQFIPMCGDTEHCGKGVKLLPGYFMWLIQHNTVSDSRLLCTCVIAAFMIIVVCGQGIIARKAEWR